MLSKKMTFSLMSLIIITAFAFVAPSAMAQVKVTPSGLTSVPHGDDDGTATATMVEIVIETDKNTDAPTLTANVFTKDGVKLVTEGANTDPDVSVATFAQTTEGGNGTQADDKTDTGTKKYITMTVPVSAYGTDGCQSSP